MTAVWCPPCLPIEKTAIIGRPIQPLLIELETYTKDRRHAAIAVDGRQEVMDKPALAAIDTIANISRQARELKQSIAQAGLGIIPSRAAARM
jgi:hypothetical protein